MAEDLIATASTVIHSDRKTVWDALVTPSAIKEYMFGTDVESDWQAGSPIRWKGEWEGKPYEDKGEILNVDPEVVLSYSHFSPMTGEPDVPENYHHVTITLADDSGETRVTLTQDGNSSEEARKHSEKNWEMMLNGLKKFIESN